MAITKDWKKQDDIIEKGYNKEWGGTGWYNNIIIKMGYKKDWKRQKYKKRYIKKDWK